MTYRPAAAAVVRLTLLLCCLVLHAPAVFAAEGPVLEAVAFETSPDGAETVTVSMTGFQAPEIFAMVEDKVPKLVCDFHGARAGRKMPHRLDTKGGLVRRVRLGVHSKPAKVRMVLDLEPGRDYELQQQYLTDEGKFKVVVLRSPAAAAASSSPTP